MQEAHKVKYLNERGPGNCAGPSRKTAMLKTALGTEVLAALQDDGVTDILVNPDGSLWIDSADNGCCASGHTLSAAMRERIIRLVASLDERVAHRNSPFVSTEIPLLEGAGVRFEGLLPPVVSMPAFVIRKPTLFQPDLQKYLQDRIIVPWQLKAIRHALEARLNMVVAGGTGSGKTTFANALLAELTHREERLIILEDTRELRSSATNSMFLKTRPGVAGLRDLVQSSLRLRPDRIVVGEVRGGEALELLKAWNTGHPGGITTVHANSASGALYRFEQLIQEVSEQVPCRLIAQAVDLVLFLEGRGGARRLREIIQVKGFTRDDYRIEKLHPANPMPDKRR